MAAVITVAAVVAAAPASALGPGPTLITSPNSKNVTGKDGRVPSTLVGDQYECARTNPEMTIVNDSERGTVRLGTDPGHLKFDIKSSPGGSWEDAYISAGNNPDGYDSAQCNWLGVGKGYVIPVPAGAAGTLTASIKLHTVARLRGRRRVRYLADRPRTVHGLRHDSHDGGVVEQHDRGHGLA